jgi:hypothetical protein
LNLDQHYEEVANFFDELDGMLSNPRPRFFVDLTTIREISTLGALVLAAKLNYWQRRFGRKLRAIGAHKWRPEIRTMLIDLGLFRLLRTKNAPERDGGEQKPQVRMLEFCTGKNSDGSLARKLTQTLTEIAGPIRAQQFLYAGLTEAMTNVSQHAYPDPELPLFETSWAGTPDHLKRWWMTGSFDDRENRMRIVILDLGVGIPTTLPRSGKWEEIRGILTRLNFNDDAHLIQAAVEAGRSSVASSAGRGLGLHEVRDFVENSQSGWLRILSRRGEVVYQKGSPDPARRGLQRAFAGTLIEWDVFR